MMRIAAVALALAVVACNAPASSSPLGVPTITAAPTTPPPSQTPAAAQTTASPSPQASATAQPAATTQPTPTTQATTAPTTAPTPATTTAPPATIVPTAAPTTAAPTVAVTPTPPPATAAPTPTVNAPRPVVYIVHSAENYMHVQYDRAMRQSGAGAANVLTSYLLDGRAFPAGSTIVCGSPTCDVVRIDMPSNLAPGSAHTVTVRGVVSSLGAPLNPDPTIAPFRTDTQGG